MQKIKISQILGISESQFSFVLDGKRNLEYLMALDLAEIIPSNPIIWIKGGGTRADRLSAFYAYKLTKRMKQKGAENA